MICPFMKNLKEDRKCPECGNVCTAYYESVCDIKEKEYEKAKTEYISRINTAEEQLTVNLDSLDYSLLNERDINRIYIHLLTVNNFLSELLYEQVINKKIDNDTHNSAMKYLVYQFIDVCERSVGKDNLHLFLHFLRLNRPVYLYGPPKSGKTLISTVCQASGFDVHDWVESDDRVDGGYVMLLRGPNDSDITASNFIGIEDEFKKYIMEEQYRDRT